MSVEKSEPIPSADSVGPNDSKRRLVVAWLWLVIVFVFAMVVVGGITRLTHSGLSMVDWRPMMGALPPLSEGEWNTTFDLYKQFPEYLKSNPDMNLEEFKGIFYWEYGHRLLGRTVGLVFLLPFLYFWRRGEFKGALFWKLLGAFFLGGLQGVLGWYMVKSGLVDIPRVSHYRLAAHLSLALFLMVYLYWLVLDLTRRKDQPGPPSSLLRRLAWGTTALVCLQIVYGAFTAGLKAGRGYNTFPSMNGQWVPEAIGFSEPVWRDLLESGAGVQFMHRLLGTLLLLVVMATWGVARRSQISVNQGNGLNFLLGLLLIQYGLGVYVLIQVVPVVAASVHQAVGCLVLMAAVHTNHLFHIR